MTTFQQPASLARRVSALRPSMIPIRRIERADPRDVCAYPQRVHQQTTQGPAWVIWLACIGIFLPYTVRSTGKYVIVPLLPLAVFHFLSCLFLGQRRFMASDLFICAGVMWIMAAEIVRSGSLSLATASDALAFLGAYLVARSYVFGDLSKFLQAFKIVAIALIALAALDTFSGHFFVRDVVTAIFPDPREQSLKGMQDIHRKLFGFNVIRATSTFDHPILFGSFCSVAAAIFLFSVRSSVSRIFYFVACSVGCILSVSSAAVLGIVVCTASYFYDRILEQYSSRWKVFWVGFLGLIGLMFLFSNRPLGFLLDHLTLNPETGYYRELIWQSAITYIRISPLLGFGGGPALWSTDDILGDSIDSVWLMLALSHGLPTVICILLATFAACRSSSRGGARAPRYFETQRLRTGFSLVLSMFVFLGLTVHFWDALWMFWGFCIGVRTSLKELQLALRQDRRAVSSCSNSPTPVFDARPRDA
jgi:O-Antigen ligase